MSKKEDSLLINTKVKSLIGRINTVVSKVEGATSFSDLENMELIKKEVGMLKYEGKNFYPPIDMSEHNHNGMERGSFIFSYFKKVSETKITFAVHDGGDDGYHYYYYAVHYDFDTDTFTAGTSLQGWNYHWLDPSVLERDGFSKAEKIIDTVTHTSKYFADMDGDGIPDDIKTHTCFGDNYGDSLYIYKDKRLKKIIHKPREGSLLLYKAY